MNVITSNPNSHLKSAVAELKSSDGLAFQSSLSQKEIVSAVSEINYRNRYNFYLPEMIVWLFLSQKLENGTMDSTVAKLIALLASQGKETPSSNTAAYSQALSKLPEALLSNLARNSANNLEEEIPDAWIFQGRSLKLMDGTTVSMPDTADNQANVPATRLTKRRYRISHCAYGDRKFICKWHGIGFSAWRIFWKINRRARVTAAIVDGYQYPRKNGAVLNFN